MYTSAVVVGERQLRLARFRGSNRKDGGKVNRLEEIIEIPAKKMYVQLSLSPSVAEGGMIPADFPAYFTQCPKLMSVMDGLNLVALQGPHLVLSPYFWTPAAKVNMFSIPHSYLLSL